MFCTYGKTTRPILQNRKVNLIVMKFYNDIIIMQIGCVMWKLYHIRL